MGEAFTLHPRLSGANTPVAELRLSTALLKDDARWPWLVLVPRRAGLRELHELSGEDAAALWDEIRSASAAIAALDGVEKVNVGALGNEVSQLHVHIVGRRTGDPAWPGPVWGVAGKIPYPEGAAAILARRLAAAMMRDV